LSAKAAVPNNNATRNDVALIMIVPFLLIYRASF